MPKRRWHPCMGSDPTEAIHNLDMENTNLPNNNLSKESLDYTTIVYPGVIKKDRFCVCDSATRHEGTEQI
ncbi:unnamed protein product [Echinostoma caproni]|uniref:Uncharacterized protein n=1 Tax=Echinostoma caproni TaxID=27848 RepID=A0A183A9S7_9TREM|nr:unnamed protein product [Echinostoma caproni]